ncbi:hypothetical protein ABTL81_20100, partial [Acinetobacter baumannii]
AEREGRRLYPNDWPGAPRPRGGRGTQGGQLDLGPILGRSGVMLAAGSPDVFTQYCENCPNLNTNAPRAAIGKLFTNAGSCSASV